MLQYIQHGVGLSATASVTPLSVTFSEGGHARAAGTVSVKNKGSASVLVLINASTDPTELAAQFTNLTPILLEANDTFVFEGAEGGGAVRFTSVALKTAASTATVIVNAY